MPQTTDTPDTASPVTRRCMNCGTVSASNYCPECGQAMTLGRLSLSSLLHNAVSGIFKINRGVLFTAGQLLVHPWTVIRDYVHGKRVRYTEPVLMLVILCFINSLITWTIQSYGTPAPHPDAPVPDNAGSGPVRFILTLLSTLIQNDVFVNLICFIPALIVIPVVYRKAGTRRFNAAEYLVAMVYMSCAALTFDILVIPLDYFGGIAAILSIIYLITVTAIGLYKAFPFKTRQSSIRHFLYYIVLVALCYLLVFILFILIYILVASTMMPSVPHSLELNL